VNEAETEANSHEADIRGQICINCSAKFYILIPFSQKNEIFDRFSTELQKLWLKTGFIMGTLSVRTVKTTSFAFGRRLLLFFLRIE